MKSLLTFILLIGGILAGNSQTLWFTNITDTRVSFNLNGEAGGGTDGLFVDALQTGHWSFETAGLFPQGGWLDWEINQPYFLQGGISIPDGYDVVLNYQDGKGFVGASVVPEPSEGVFALLAFGALGRFLSRRKTKQTKGKSVKKLGYIVRKSVDVVVPVGRSAARVGCKVMALAILFLFGVIAVPVVHAQSTNFPDTSTLITGPQTGFNTALTWVIGALGVLIVIAWILKAMRRR